MTRLVFLFNHFDVLFRTNGGAKTAPLAEIRVESVGILPFSFYAGFGTNQKAHTAGDAVLLQVFRPFFGPP